MRKLIVTALVLAVCSIAVHAPRAAAAGYTNASVAGSWGCASTGSAAVKNAKGATSWVPANGVTLAVLDGAGKFTSGKVTSNIAGMTCSSTITGGSYNVNADGSGTYTSTQKADSSNSPKCPPAETTTVTGVASNNMFVGVSTDSGATFSFFCIKQGGQ
jgi:hypothetical protein